MHRSFRIQMISTVLLLCLALSGCAIIEASDEVEQAAGGEAQVPQAQISEGPASEGTYGVSEVDYLTTVAMRDLADRLGVNAIWISTESVSPRQFADSSLGLPQPDHVYSQVITPGYIIQLRIDDRLYRYHGSGRRIVYGGPVTEQPAEARSAATASESDSDLKAITLVFATRTAFSSNGISISESDFVSVERMVVVDDATPSVALELLFRGPTEAERDKGADSCFSNDTQGLYRSLHVEGNVAYVDLNEPAGLLDTLTSERGLRLFDTQVMQTLQGMIDVERAIYAIEGEPAAFYRWVGLGCALANGFCDPRPFMPTPVPLAQAPPTLESNSVIGVNASLALGPEATVMRQVAADLNGDGMDEWVLLSGSGAAMTRSDSEPLQISVICADAADPTLVWQADVRGISAEPLQVMDLDGDGLPEVLLPQTLTDSGRSLYVVSWDHGAYDLLRPSGGYFDGCDAYGKAGFGLEDDDADGIVEILAVYGPSGTRVDTYRWNGAKYVYEATDDYGQ